MPLCIAQASIDIKLKANFFLYTISDLVFCECAVRLAFLDNALLAHGECPYHISTEAAAARFGILEDPKSGRPGYVRLSSEMRFVTSHSVVCPKCNWYLILYCCSGSLVWLVAVHMHTHTLVAASLMECKCRPTLVKIRKTGGFTCSPSGIYWG